MHSPLLLPTPGTNRLVVGGHNNNNNSTNSTNSTNSSVKMVKSVKLEREEEMLDSDRVIYQENDKVVQGPSSDDGWVQGPCDEELEYDDLQDEESEKIKEAF